jgi:hypothetical protein
MFNNDGDSIRLLDSSENEMDEIVYSSSLTDRTWGRTDFSSLNTCALYPTKSRENTSCIVVSEKSIPSPTPRISTASTINHHPTSTNAQSSSSVPTSVFNQPVRKKIPITVTNSTGKNIQGIQTTRSTVPENITQTDQPNMSPIKGLSLTSMLLSLGSMISIVFKMLRK